MVTDITVGVLHSLNLLLREQPSVEEVLAEGKCDVHVRPRLSIPRCIAKAEGLWRVNNG